MEITQDQFTTNLEQMPQQAQVQVVQLIEQNEPPVLQAFAASLGVTLSMGEEPMAEEPMPQEQPSVLDEVMAEEPVAPEEPAPVEAPLPEASPMQDQMQQLALGDQVAGMIDQPGAEDQTGVADDVPMNAREGAFIVNAAAIAKVGKKDFEERIIEPAIEYLKEKEGIEVDKGTITRPAQQVKGDQQILASNKEYHIPPELAEVIGTDLLEKINKRGEAETEKKLEEQEQQPQQQQQQQDFAQKQVPVRAANGGEIEPEKKLFANLQTALIEEEGFEPNAYIPTQGDKPTIGYGSTENVRLGQTIDEPNARIRLGTDIRKRLPRIRKEIPIFSSLPVEVQTPIFVEYFRGKLTKAGSPNTVKLINQGKYKEASKQFLNSDEYRNAKTRGREGIRERMEKASKAIASIASPRPKRKPAPPAQQTQNSFMGAPPIGSREDEMRNLKARRQGDEAGRLKAELMQPPAN